MKKNNENQIISFRKYIFAVSVIFTSLLCFNHIKASTFECAETVSFCVKTSGGNGSGNCTERLSVCNKYKEDVLKCEEWVNGFDMKYREWKEQEMYEVCRWPNEDKPNSTCYKQSYGVKPCYAKNKWRCFRTVTRSTYDRVNVKVCSRWDINVKFGNAEIDPNLIEY